MKNTINIELHGTIELFVLAGGIPLYDDYSYSIVVNTSPGGFCLRLNEVLSSLVRNESHLEDFMCQQPHGQEPMKHNETVHRMNPCHG